MTHTWNDPAGSATLPSRAKIIGLLECADDNKFRPTSGSFTFISEVNE